MWNPIHLKNFGQCFYFNIVILTKLCPPQPKNNIDGERFRDQYAWLKKFMTQHQMSSHARILILQIPRVESQNGRHETEVKQNVALIAWKKKKKNLKNLFYVDTPNHSSKTSNSILTIFLMHNWFVWLDLIVFKTWCEKQLGFTGFTSLFLELLKVAGEEYYWHVCWDIPLFLIIRGNW